MYLSKAPRMVPAAASAAGLLSQEAVNPCTSICLSHLGGLLFAL